MTLVNIDAELENADWPKRSKDTFAALGIGVRHDLDADFESKHDRDDAGRFTEMDTANATVFTTGMGPGEETPPLERWPDRAESDITNRTLTVDQEEALGAYAGLEFRPINNWLRGTIDEHEIERDTKQQIQLIDEAFGAGNEAKQDQTLYRGISYRTAARLQRLKPGERFVDHGFVSVSADKDTAESFKKSHIGKLVAVQIPKGTPAIDMQNSESEVLLPRDTTFQVIRNTPTHMVVRVVKTKHQPTTVEQIYAQEHRQR